MLAWGYRYEIASCPKNITKRSKIMKKFSFKWENFLQLVLLFVGTYGERIFVALHAFIRNMKPESFSFVCLTVVFIALIKLTQKD